MKKISMLLTCLYISACGFEIVDTGFRGIETRFGEVIKAPLNEGIYFYNPITSNILEYSVRTEKWTNKTSVFTKDTQNVVVEFSVIYSIDPNFVGTAFKEYGTEADLANKVITPVVLGSLKDAIGQVIADELIQSRETVTKHALEKTAENLKSVHILVSDLQFTNLDFDDQYEKAVEEKVVAIQSAQKAKNTTVQIEEEAKQTVKTAQAEAEAMKIKSAALSQNKGLVEFEIAKRWDGKLPTYMFGNSIPMLDIKSLNAN